MYTAIKNIYRERVGFQKINTSIPIPNLIEIQKNSYERFLQMRVLPAEREDAGLQSVFKSVFPITDLRENCSLEFVEYSIGNWECKCGRLVGLDKLGRPCTFCAATIIMDPRGDREIHCPKCGHLNENRPVTCDTCDEPVGLKLKYDVDECQERGMTFAVPLKVTIRLVVWDKDPDTQARTIRDIKEQEVYFGDIPLMTDNGTFIINGTERVIVSQLHRSPGVFFSQPEKGLFAAQIIPYRGSWVEFEYDSKNLLHVRIDRKRKFLATVFLRAMGLKTDAEILKTFYKWDKIVVREGKLYWQFSENLLGLKLSKSIHGPKDASGKREELLHAGKKITAAVLQQLRSAGVEEIEITEADLELANTVSDIVDPRTGEVILEANEALNPRVISVILDPNAQVGSFDVFFPERDETGAMMSATVKKDAIKTPEEALIEIYRRMRPGDPPTLDSSRNLFEGMFLNPQKYDFSRVGRLKLNTKLGLSSQLGEKILHLEDITAVIAFLLKLRRNPAEVDDIDHLGNRRVRSVGELLENQFRIGLVRMERAIKEKMSVYQEMATAMPHDLINAKPVMASIREFFGSSQLSQFMDQTNPLSEITHKRRLSRPWAGRPLARARRVRGARRAPDALRPHLPHRDAGRPEHRPHLVALVLRPHQRVRVHREPVPEGEAAGACSSTTRSSSRARRATRSATSSRRTSSSAPRPTSRRARRSRRKRSLSASTSRPGKRTSTRSPRPTSSSATTGRSSRIACPPARPATSCWPSVRKSTTSTSAPSSSCRWRPRSSRSWRTTTPTAR